MFADAATVCVQVGIGLALLTIRRGLLARAALVLSIGWAMVVWIGGEGFGGILEPGAAWLTGVPGAALVYVAAGAVLLLPWASWRTGRAARLARRGSALWLVVAALLQLLPAGAGWSSSGAGGAVPRR